MIESNERRHGSIIYKAPIFCSMYDLLEKAKDDSKSTNPDGESIIPPAPCEEWLRLQFQPRNRWTKVAENIPVELT